MRIKRTNFVTKISRSYLLPSILILFSTNSFSQWKTAETTNINSDIIISYEVIYDRELTVEEKKSPAYINEIVLIFNKDILVERKFGSKISSQNNFTLLNYKTLKGYNCYVSESSKIGLEYNFYEPKVPVKTITDSTQKSVFGYPCERAVVNINNNPKEVIYTKKIGLKYCLEFMIDGFLLEYPGFSKRLGNYTVKAKKITYNNSLPESLFSLDGFTIQTMEDYAKKSKEKEEKFREQRSRMIGIKAPNFSERSIKNKKLDSKKLLDQIIVYNFWFTTCPPCKAEIPKLNQLRDKYKDKNIEFIAIALDPEYLIQEYIQKNPFNYDIIAEGRWIAEKFEISSYPTNIVVDKKGVVQFYEVGYKSDIVERMSNEIDKIFSPEN
jgi:thiol-disulfide isomerase/thioredoxin